MQKQTGTKESWSETKKKLKKIFAILTDSDVLLIEGKKEKLIERLQKKLGKSKEEIQKIIAEL